MQLGMLRVIWLKTSVVSGRNRLLDVKLLMLLFKKFSLGP
jgi:hypothetical protein